MGRNKNWTAEEIQFLEDKWGALSVESIAKRLDRSPNAINVMKNRIGLGAFLESGEYVTFNQLLLSLGITGGSGYFMTSWVRNRNFPLKYKRVLNNRFKVVYLKDFWGWAEKNRSMIDWSKVEQRILGQEPNWVKAQREADFQTKSKIKTTPWTRSEDELLKSLLKQFRYSYKDLSKRLLRTEGAIQRRITDLGLKERPLKADNHILWTAEEYHMLGEMLKQRLSYELMSERLGKSVKALRGRVYDMYLTENLDKVASLIGNGHWGDGRPERKITHRLLTGSEKQQVKNDIAKIAGILKGVIRKHYNDNDFWQKDLCMNWKDGCTAGETNCDDCKSFIRIRPQFCRRCGVTFIKREKTDLCDRCKVMRKKQYQRKWVALQQIQG